MGDNSNVASWNKHRKPRNRAAQYLARMLNRLGTDYNFTVFVCFISSSNNNLRGELSRFTLDDPAMQFGKWDLPFSDVLPALKWFLAERLGNLSLILPTDLPGRVRAIMQFVEKRMARPIPERVKSQTQFVFFGAGPNWRLQPRVHTESHGLSTAPPHVHPNAGTSPTTFPTRNFPDFSLCFHTAKPETGS